jgi:hypothetical protein
MEIEYKDYEKLIRSRANYWYRKTGRDLDELLLQGNLAFSIALEKYKPSKGSFSTLLWYELENYIGNFAKWNGARRSVVPVCSTDNGVDVSNYSEKTWNPETHLIFKELLHSLSEEAQEVVKTIFNCPDELLTMIKDSAKKRKLTQKTLKEYLETYNKVDSTDAVFLEIKTALRV